MNIEDLKTDGLFTNDGNNVWSLESCFLEPSCVLKNIITGEETRFGINSLEAKRFRKINLSEKE
jgi:hypothetical protein